MPAHANTHPLYTQVKNGTGATRVFGFLGNHGMELVANEVVLVRGDLVTKLGNERTLRRFNALEAALLSGDLILEARPAPILFDQVESEPRQLHTQNDALGTIDPEWTPPTNSIFVPAAG